MTVFKNVLAAAGAVFIALLVIIFIVTLAFGPGGGGADKVAVVTLEGMIVDSTGLARELKELRKREDVKAVVVRVNSPGGAVAPSQEIHAELRRLAEKKRVVASMGTVAASGGYYASVGADKIVANPGTVTGSIGVIVEFMNAEGLMKKVGLEGYVLKTGRYKDVGSPFRRMEPDEEKMIRRVIDDVRDQFVRAVAEGRGKSLEEISKIADGRIFTGSQALELGLVDRLGGLAAAIDLGAELAGIEGEPEVIYTGRRGFDWGAVFSGAASFNISDLISDFRIMYLTQNPQW